MTDKGAEIVLPKDRVPREPKDHRFVNAGEGMLAVKIDAPGDIFHLSSMPDQEVLGADQFTDAYIVDEKGKRYWIRRDRIESMVEMVERKRSDDAENEDSFYITFTDPEIAEQLTLTIGEPFSLGGNSTANIKEVTTLNRRPAPSLVLPAVEGLERSTVINDFVLASTPPPPSQE